ncbi:hypothetical protein V6N13_045221 [Hibiscus sabdariffa]
MLLKNCSSETEQLHWNSRLASLWAQKSCGDKVLLHSDTWDPPWLTLLAPALRPPISGFPSRKPLPPIRIHTQGCRLFPQKHKLRREASVSAGQGGGIFIIMFE